MDAATLYIVMTLANGEEKTSTVEFGTLRACEQKAEWFQLIERRKSPNAVVSIRCVEHKVRPAFYLTVYDWRSRPRDHFGPSSRQGCTAYQWVVHMRDRRRKGSCYESPRSTDAAEPEREPNLPNYFDMLGQPGQ